MCFACVCAGFMLYCERNFSETSHVMRDVRSCLDGIQHQLASVSLCADIDSKRQVLLSLQKVDVECERGLDLIHNLQQRAAGLLPSLALDVQAMIDDHAKLSTQVQASTGYQELIDMITQCSVLLKIISSESNISLTSYCVMFS